MEEHDLVEFATLFEAWVTWHEAMLAAATPCPCSSATDSLRP